jgi:hypothetical protein
MITAERLGGVSVVVTGLYNEPTRLSGPFRVLLAYSLQLSFICPQLDNIGRTP